MDYPGIKCLNPHLLRNKYTNQIQMSSCGVCKACLMKKSKLMAFRCSLHELNYKYVYFITLTYDNNHVPLAKLNYYEPMKGYFITTECQRHIDYRKQIGFDNPGIGFLKDSDLPKTGLDLYLTKLNCNSLVPYAFFRDAQLFLKRLRKQYNKYDSEEKIKYYLCSEYGPVHFRPHYHIVIYHNSDKINTYWYKCIRACWSYGRVDASTSRGKTSSYVASYVNSSCSLPSIYSQPEFKPKASHSSFIGCELPHSKITAIYENDPKQFMSQCVNFGNKYVEYSPWRAYEDKVFPRCKSYTTKSYSQLARTYGLITAARKKYGNHTIDYFAKKIYFSFFDYKYQNKKDILRDYFLDSLDIKEFCAKRIYSRPKYVDDWYHNQIASELYLSKRFVDVICNGDLSLFPSRLKRLIFYYEVKELVKLSNFYELQSVYADKTTDKLSIMLFYDNLKDIAKDGSKFITDAAIRLFYQLGGFNPDKNIYSCVNVRSSSIFNEFLNSVNQDYEKAIKHKKLNDLNKIFL